MLHQDAEKLQIGDKVGYLVMKPCLASGVIRAMQIRGDTAYILFADGEYVEVGLDDLVM